MKQLFIAALASLIWLGQTSQSQAEVVIDYSNDGGFFTSNTTAKAALEAAVSDINAVIDFVNIGAITNDVTSGVDGSSFANFDFGYSYTHPSAGTMQTINDTTLGAGEIKIFVGARNLAPPTLGQGGPGGVGFGASSSSTSAASLQAAVNNAMSNEQHSRGGGPTMNTASGSLGSASYSFDFGPTVGNLWFDSVDTSWHFDHTTPVASGTSDFYTVALHETLHAIGFGGSATWNDLTSGTAWLGTEANLINNGTGIGLIDVGGAHITDGTMSLTIADGTMQEAVMDPSITDGTRKYLTELDVAFLRDLNYITVTAVPEPSTFATFMVLVSGGVCIRRRRSTI
ncbi:hypothetical protein CA13_05260 [Planctomycetes bacterium CA13]|uniref:PEP-CTERM protein-sorting domain-containing protein n=1 Tax=Novipirellula herctigrandis TaxID=2527986 RepID=A0A5C5YVS8_9BACT|nr:hypothetical protein CA13_05260 [Planctomycetes bacterium CA13]